MTDATALDALASKQVVPGYIGFDPTAPSLHVGSLVQIMLLRRLQQAGHKPIVLMGGGTGKIGDPSFKDEARKLMTDETIAANVASIKRVFERFLTFGDGPTDAMMVDNAEWLDALEYIPFLRDVGQHFSVNRMLSFDSVKLRLDREQSLSFLEFNYMILQAYDFLELSRRAGCRLQMGGSDQWGNIVNGIELARRIDGTEVFGITTPLITTADGGKMGKTMAGAVWLNEDPLPALRLLAVLAQHRRPRCRPLPAPVHRSAARRDRPARSARGRRDQRGQEDPRQRGDRPVPRPGRRGGSRRNRAPTVRGRLGGRRAADLRRRRRPHRHRRRADRARLRASKGEARRLIKGGGARVDGEKVTDEAMTITAGRSDPRGGGQEEPWADRPGLGCIAPVMGRYRCVSWVLRRVEFVKQVPSVLLYAAPIASVLQSFGGLRTWPWATPPMPKAASRHATRCIIARAASARMHARYRC